MLRNAGFFRFRLRTMFLSDRVRDFFQIAQRRVYCGDSKGYVKGKRKFSLARSGSQLMRSCGVPRGCCVEVAH